MRILAPISPAVQSEIDACFEALLANPTLWPSWPGCDPLAGMDLAGLLKDVKPEPRRDIDKNQLMPLAEVARVSGLSLSALRTEARKGTLAVARIAGKDFATLADIERMVETCRVAVKAPACGSDQPGVVEPKPLPGLSSTGEDRLALAAALMRAKKLKSGSPITSPINTSRNVVSVRFPKPESRT
jgi:hypothetical protein